MPKATFAFTVRWGRGRSPETPCRRGALRLHVLTYRPQACPGSRSGLTSGARAVLKVRRMKSSRLRAIPSVDKVLQSLGDTGLPGPVVVDAVRRHLKALRSRKTDSTRRYDHRGHPRQPAGPARVPARTGDQRDRDSRPHQSRSGAARARQHSRALDDRGQLQHARIQSCRRHPRRSRGVSGTWPCDSLRC